MGDIWRPSEGTKMGDTWRPSEVTQMGDMACMTSRWNTWQVSMWHPDEIHDIHVTSGWNTWQVSPSDFKMRHSHPSDISRSKTFVLPWWNMASKSHLRTYNLTVLHTDCLMESTDAYRSSNRTDGRFFGRWSVCMASLVNHLQVHCWVPFDGLSQFDQAWLQCLVCVSWHIVAMFFFELGHSTSNEMMAHALRPWILFKKCLCKCQHTIKNWSRSEDDVRGDFWKSAHLTWNDPVALSFGLLQATLKCISTVWVTHCATVDTKMVMIGSQIWNISLALLIVANVSYSHEHHILWIIVRSILEHEFIFPLHCIW